MNHVESDSNCRFSVDRIDNVAVILSATLTFIAITPPGVATTWVMQMFIPIFIPQVNIIMWALRLRQEMHCWLQKSGQWLYEVMPLSEILGPGASRSLT